MTASLVRRQHRRGLRGCAPHQPRREQARGEHLDRRSDLYALGAAIYELIAGRPPFSHPNQMDLLEAIVGKEPPTLARINPGAPPMLCTLAERLLAKDPAHRPGTAMEVALALATVHRALVSRPSAVLTATRETRQD